MQIRTLFLAVFLTAIPAFTVLAQRPIDQIEYPPLKDFEVPEAERVDLPNGMVLFLIADPELPLVNMSARIGTGSVYEPADKVGLAAITGTVMRTGGTATRTGDEINEQLESMGSIVETSIGTESGSAYMSALKEYTRETLELFADILMNPAFAEDKIQIAKTQQKSMISRRNDDPQDIAFREFGEAIFGSDSPYARSPEYYTIDAISRDDLLAFHNRFFVPNNVYLSVWGDFEKDAMVQTIREAFSSWKKDDDFVRPTLPPLPPATEAGVYFIPKEDVNQSTILIGHVGELRQDHEDYPEVQLMNDVLSGGFAGRLMRNVRSDQGLAYAVFGAYTAEYDHPGLFYSGVLSKSESTVRATRSVLEQIESMQTVPPTEDELALAREAFLNSFVFNYDTKSEIVQRMMTLAYYGYPLDFLEKTREEIEQATADDVVRVANRYLKPDQSKILVVGRAEDFDEPLSALGAVQEIDITIPTRPPGEAAPQVSSESMTEGKELLNRMIAALGGSEAFSRISNMKINGTQRANTPAGEFQMESAVTVDLPDPGAEIERMMAGSGRLLINQSTPGGAFVIVLDGDQAVVKGPQGTQSLPEPLRQQIKDELWRDITYLARFADHPDLQAHALGTEEFDGSPRQALRITPGSGSPFTLFLDPESNLPSGLRYESIDPTSGAPVASEDRFDDFRQVGDILLPHRIVTYRDGEISLETTLTSVQFNTEVDDSLFDVQ